MKVPISLFYLLFYSQILILSFMEPKLTYLIPFFAPVTMFLPVSYLALNVPFFFLSHPNQVTPRPSLSSHPILSTPAHAIILLSSCLEFLPPLCPLIPVSPLPHIPLSTSSLISKVNVLFTLQLKYWQTQCETAQRALYKQHWVAKESPAPSGSDCLN